MPHGMCYLWKPDLLALHVVSDVLIAVAYYSIPFGITYFLSKRRDLYYPWLFRLFAMFILACGTTHIFNTIVIWYPAYYIEGFMKAITAAVSVGTAVLLWYNMDKLIALPTLEDVEQSITNRKRAKYQGLLLKELHHRMKNTMQTVCSLLSLQMRRLSEHEAYMMEDTIARIRSIARVYEQMQGKTDSCFDLNTNLEDMINEIAKFWHAKERGIETTYKGSQALVHVDKATSLMLILHELISNAYKYATNGQVSIVLSGTESVAVKITNPIAEQIPFPDCMTGLGIRLVRGLCEQIDATMDRDFTGPMAVVDFHMKG